MRRVKEGTSAVLLQSGVDENWWAYFMECYTYLRNIQDLLSGGKTPYERRFGEHFEGQIIPFGSLVECYPSLCEGPVKNPSIWKESLTWIQKSTLEDSIKVEFFSSRRWTNQTPWRRSGTENIHLDTGAPNPRRMSTLIFSENQKGLLLHHLTTRFRMPVKR